MGVRGRPKGIDVRPDAGALARHAAPPLPGAGGAAAGIAPAQAVRR